MGFIDRIAPALIKGVGGYARGKIEYDEAERVRNERAKLQAAQELIQRQQMERQSRMDAQQSDRFRLDDQRADAETAAKMSANGFTRARPGMMQGADAAFADGAAELPGMGGMMARAAAPVIRAKAQADAPAIADAQGGYLKTGMSDQERMRQDATTARQEELRARIANENAQKELDRAARLEQIREGVQGRKDLASIVSARGGSAPVKLRVVPSGTVKDHQGINANINELDEIERLLSTPAADQALGLKNMLPEWVATRGLSDDALTLRGKLSNVTSGVFLERSGAAVTPSEAKRLEGWTANLTDNPAKARNAVKNMRAFFEAKKADMENAYGEESGYHPLPRSQQQRAAGAGDGAAKPVPGARLRALAGQRP